MTVINEFSTVDSAARETNPGTITSQTWTIASLLGLIAGAISFGGSWVPSVWTDEQATLSAATRPLPEMVSLVTNTLDAVHGLYYFFMHYWFALVGVHDWSFRLPSAIAVGLAVMGIVVLGAMLVNLRVGFLAGVLLALIPQTQWVATEARSYGLTVMLAVWLSIVLVLAVTSSRWWWLAYAFLGTISVTVFIYLTLLVAAHAITVIALRAWRRSWWLFGLSALAIVVCTIPVLRLAVAQRGQVSWIGPISRQTIFDVLADQWFDSSVWVAGVFWILIGAGIVIAIVRRRSDPSAAGVVLLALPWLIAPTAALVLGSLVMSPLYVGRYVAFSVPAVALLGAVALASIRSKFLIAAGLVIILGLSTPLYLAQRAPLAKGTDWRDASMTMGEHSQPGDAVFFSRAESAVYPYARSMLFAYPDAVGELKDIALATSYETRANFFDELEPFETAVLRLGDSNRVWMVNPAGYAWSGSTDEATLRALGFSVQQVYPGNSTSLVLLSRHQ
ncbi:glycosyltransferase family 39 protein [Cryobacterium sp. Y50]|uniref:glycosyltransferase family 39 protein n=1 Tax=Cryobacterium sp. Y50 TaxID=2048286 RepID=UPI000CE56A0B|nr:glycosyltransferase family 39 protein [Cryobacterium sp. Y50]